eukprot:3915293-Prymnesium_polylepis.2
MTDRLGARVPTARSVRLWLCHGFAQPGHHGAKVQRAKCASGDDIKINARRAVLQNGASGRRRLRVRRLHSPPDQLRKHSTNGVGRLSLRVGPRGRAG